MKLNKTDVLALKSLANSQKKTSEIAAELHLSIGRASTILSKLHKLGLAKKQGWNYSLGQTPHATAIRMLLRRQPNLALENILQETEFKILKSLNEGQKRVEEIAEEIQKTRRTVYLKLGVFQSMGLAVNMGAGTYAINRDSPTYRELKPLLEAKTITPPFDLEESDGWVAWSGDNEYILKAGNIEKLKNKILEKKLRWKYTSESALDHYGIHLIPPETTVYAYSGKDRIKDEGGDYAPMEDVIVHMFLDGTEKAWEHSKWLLLLHKDETDIQYLRRTARRHNLTREIEGLLYEVKPVIRT
ncbi:MAG: ArsR family transcriptional regulator [Candidatus Altiarchaeota archaeon]